MAGAWSQESTAGVALGVMAQVRSGIFVGGEARYLRKYDGLGLDALAGQGFFIGPTIYVKLSEKAWITVAWSAQAAGRATASAAGALSPGRLSGPQAWGLSGANISARWCALSASRARAA